MTDAMQILRAATKGGTINETEVSSRIRDLLDATGCSHEDEFGRMFDEFASNKQTDHRALAIAFGEIAKAQDSEIVGLVEHFSKQFPGILTQLKTGTRTPNQFSSAGLPAPPEVRRRAARNGTFHKAMVRTGAPRKTLADTLLIGLADIFREATQKDARAIDLPHSQHSYFIQFARACLLPFFHGTEVSASALSERWRRLKRDEEASALDE